MSEKSPLSNSFVPYRPISLALAIALGAAVWALVIGGWMLLTYGGRVPEMFLPAPGKVLMTAGRLIADGSLLMHTAASAQVVLVGFVISSIVAVPLGL